MIATWVLRPSVFIALWISSDSLFEDMHDLVRVGATISPFVLHHWLRRKVPSRIVHLKPNAWMLALGFAAAIGLLAATIANNSRMMAIAAAGMGTVFLYVAGWCMVEEVRLFRDPLRFLRPRDEVG